MKSIDNQSTSPDFLRDVRQSEADAHTGSSFSADSRPFFHFNVSLNEEHTWLHIVCEGQRIISLGERIHHYSLLTLARRRLADANRGYESDSQGWLSIEQLSKMLALDAKYLNIQIFRARQQCRKHLPDATSIATLIERRRGEIRFGRHSFRIMRGAKLEGEFILAPEENSETALLRASA